MKEDETGKNVGRSKSRMRRGGDKDEEMGKMRRDKKNERGQKGW